jgi:hypothetical protein
MIPISFQRITRRQGGGNAGPPRRIEEADDATNKVSQRKLIGMSSTNNCLIFMNNWRK